MELHDLLLRWITDLYLTICGFSYASAWIELYKQAKKNRHSDPKASERSSTLTLTYLNRRCCRPVTITSGSLSLLLQTCMLIIIVYTMIMYDIKFLKMRECNAHERMLLVSMPSLRERSVLLLRVQCSFNCSLCNFLVLHLHRQS